MDILSAIDAAVDREINRNLTTVKEEAASIRDEEAPELKVKEGWITVDGSGVYFRVEEIVRVDFSQELVRVHLRTGDILEGTVPSNGYFLMNLNAMITRNKD